MLGLAVAAVVIVVGVIGLVPSVRSALTDGLFGNDPSGVASQPGDEAVEASTDATTETGLLTEQPGSLQVGDMAPNFRLRTVDGEAIELADYRGEKHVILNFWATWCPPCVAEMPEFQEIYERHSEELVVLGVDLMESKEAIRKFLDEEVDVAYPILLDPKGAVSGGYRLFTQPTTYFIDKQGRVAPIDGQPAKNGAFTAAELEQRVAELLSAEDAQATDASSSDADSEAGDAEGDAPKAPSTTATDVQTEVKTGDLSGTYFSARRASEMGFDVDPTNVKYAASISPGQIMSGGPPPDGIPSIDAPTFQSVQSASQWLEPDDVVLGVEHNGEAKAYPIRILNWHEIVNDTIGDTPIAATYCPLCGSGVVFVQPELNGQRAEFGTSGRLYNSDLVMYDRVTGTFWSQLEGKPMVGPLVGEFGELERLPNSMARWEGWRSTHPEGQVLARPTSATAMGGSPPQTDNPEDAQRVRDYAHNPYAGYDERESLMFPVPSDDGRLGNKELVSGVTLQDQAKAYLKSAVQDVGALNDFIGGVPVLVAWHPELDDVVVYRRKVDERPRPLEFQLDDGQLVDSATETIWGWDGRAEAGPLAEGGTRLDRVTSTTTFWFAWAAFHSGTQLFAPEASSGSDSGSPTSGNPPGSTDSGDATRAHGGDGTDPTSAESAAEAPSEGMGYARGDLGWKYLTEHQAKERGFEVDVENVRYADWVDLRSLRSGGQPPDGIPSVDQPRFESVASADQWLAPDDLVMTVERGDAVKAYPIRILNYHEIVNDAIGDVPIAVTFCPLCNSGLVYRRPTFEGQVAAFGTTGRLYNSDLVMYDRVTGTFWSQIEGRPMVGPLVGRVDGLTQLPSNMALWGTWKAHHSQAQVLARPTSADAIGGHAAQADDPAGAQFVRDYDTHPYADYVSSDYGTFGTLASDKRLVPKEPVVGVIVHDSAKAYRKSAVKEKRVVNDTVAGVPIVVVWSPEVEDVVAYRRDVAQRTRPLAFGTQDGQLMDRQTGTSWGWDGRALSGPLDDEGARLRRLTSTTMYWFAWAAFYPDTSLYGGSTAAE